MNDEAPESTLRPMPSPTLTADHVAAIAPTGVLRASIKLGNPILAHAYASARSLRFADGPDEVHRNAIAKDELGRYLQRP